MIATISQTTPYEQQLISVIRKLPPHYVSQVIDFAKFLEFRVIGNQNDILTDETEEEIAGNNARWDELLASDDSPVIQREKI